jgi:signal transduction histidine kinase
VLTVEGLLREMELALVAGGSAARNPVRWVHISELEDPTPGISGGEVLLTTGIRLGDQDAQREFVRRLAELRLAGLGFGTGRQHERVPDAIIDEADALDFPVFEVPSAMPFIAITERVLPRVMGELYDEQRQTMLGTLAAAVAHEVKNPLNLVINFAEANEELVASIDDVLGGARVEPTADEKELRDLVGELRVNADAIQKHGRRALDVAMSMLQLSRQETGASEAVDLNALVERYSTLAYHGLRASDRRISCEIAVATNPSLPRLQLRAADIGRVVLNLVGNACEAVSDYAYELGDPAYKPKVTVSTGQTDNTVEVRVHDNGPGIPEEIRKLAFERFFTTKGRKGTGLGLAISKEIVEQHEGTIILRSTPGEFTEVCVSLPRNE